MADGPSISPSVFPSSTTLITGGTFTIQNSTYISSGARGGYERLVGFVAPNALHNSGHIVDPPKCHPGTRVAIIQTIMNWTAGSNEINLDKFITWLTGAAGAGKSAIGRSVCERCAEEGTLLASFFFGSNDPTRNHSKSLVATIAYQICAISPGVRKAVSDFIEHDPLIFTRSLRAQFSSLVIDPLLANYTNASQRVPPLIVLDGLDECLDKPSQRDILETVLWVVTSSPIPIRFLICSRPESLINAAFSTVKMNAALFKIFLGDEYTPDADIRLYLYDHFHALREEHLFKSSIPPSWPTEEQQNQLVEKSSGLFIYAATAVRYLESPRHRPHQRLEAILGLRPPFKDLPFAELDALYLQLLNNTGNPSLASDILVFLASYGFMCPSDIELYLEREDGEVEVLLSDLGSIVKMQSDDQGTYEATLLHNSFGDFLFDSHRSKSLSKNRAETQTAHIIRLLQIFSEEYEGCRFQPGSHRSLRCLFVQDIPSYGWSKQLQSALFRALTSFAMESCCRKLFSHNVARCKETTFIYGFMSMLSYLEETEIVTGVYHRHASALCRATLSEILDLYSENWEENLIFTIKWLCMPHRSLFFVLRGLGSIMQEIYFPPKIFKIPSNDMQLLGIISRAAAYCLQFLGDVPRTHQEASNHFIIGGIAKKKRQLFPWVWRQRSHRRFGKKRVFMCMFYADNRYVSLSTYEKLFQKESDHPYRPIFSVHSMRWNNWKNNESMPQTVEIWYQYMAILEYLPRILPRAGRFPPLIHLCRTKSFAPLSMLFPNFSRRARRAIAVYLDRMDSEIGTDRVD